MEKPFLEIVESEFPEKGLLISVGLPGSWKSPVTEEISRIKGYQLLRSDLIRLEVLKGLDVFDNKVASDHANRMKVYQEMFHRAASALRTDERGLILDATFFTQGLRSQAAKLADEAHRPFIIAECVCSEEKSIERILKRTKEKYESNALTREAYLNNKALFEPVRLDELKRDFPRVPMIHVVIDTEYDTARDWKIKKLDRRG